MKGIIKFFVIVLVVGMSSSSFAQKGSKIGHIDRDSIISMMPGIDTVQTLLTNKANQLNSEYEEMTVAYQTARADFEKNVALWSETKQKIKVKEIQDMEKNIQDFQMDAQNTLMLEQERLLTPFEEKVDGVIKDVVKDNNYSYVFDTSLILTNDIGRSMLFYADPADDLMPKVKAKLGIE